MAELEFKDGKDQGICAYYLDTIKRYENHKSIDYDMLEKVLRLLDITYAQGELTVLSDEEYDQLNSIYYEKTGDVITVTDHDGIEHDYPNLKGTLSKVHYVTQEEKDNDPDRIESYKALSNWVRSTLNQLPLGKHTLGFYHKADGCSVILSLDENHTVIRAITRGDIDEGRGQDKSVIFQGITLEGMLDKRFDGKAIGLKTEAIVSFSSFEEYNKKYFNGTLADPRAAAVSLLSSVTFTEAHKKYLTLLPLMVEYEGDLYSPLENGFGPIETIDFENCDGNVVGLERELEKCIMKVTDNPPGYPRDGIVVRWIDESAIKVLGRNTERSLNNFEVAYKFRPESFYSHLIDIEQAIGYLGNASFTAVFEPIDIQGRTVTHASLGSYEIAKKLSLKKDDLVCIKYNTIPRLSIDRKCIEENLLNKNKPIKLMSKCPYCGHELEEDPILRCVNPQCSYKEMGRIYNFCVEMRMKFLGPSTIEVLFEKGYLRNILDLFTLKDKKNELKEIDRFGDLKINKIIKAVENIETTEANLIGAIGIKGIRAKRAKMVLDIYNLDALLEMSKDADSSTRKLELIRAIGYNYAMALLKGVDENREMIKSLRSLVKIKERKVRGDKNVVFTGFRDPNLANKIEDLGYEVSDNLNHKTKLVVAKDPNGSSQKLKKARDLNIPIVDIAVAYEMCKK